MSKIAIAILIGLTLLGGGWWFVSTRLLAEPPPPHHPTTQVVQGVPLDTELANDPLPPVTSEMVFERPPRGSSNLPKVTKTTKPEHAKFSVVQFEALSDFNYERPRLTADGMAAPLPDQIPAEVKAHNGKAACVAGFIQPLDLDDKGKASHFMLMRTQSLCCYGAPLSLQDWIDVKLDGGRRVKPELHVPVFVLGTLEVGEDLSHGYIASLFRLKAEKILAPGEVP